MSGGTNVMKTFWIIKAGSTFADTARRYGDFEQWTRESLGLAREEVSVWDATSNRPLPDPSRCLAVVVTGAHAMVTEALPWSVQLEEWIPELVETRVPFLGICYGHQLLARAMGGEVDYHPGGREIGTVSIDLLPAADRDPLLRGLSRSPLVHAVHSQTVVQPPPGAVRLARNEFEPNHAFRIGTSAWGVQFHPEYDQRIMRAYIEHLADELATTGCNVVDLLRSVRDTPAARSVPLRFAELARQQATY